METSAYEKVTERILQKLTEGNIPWKQPWSTMPANPRNYVTGRQYNGINHLLLSSMGYQSPYYMTFKQVREAGGTIKKGSEGFPIVFWNFIDVPNKRMEKEERGEPDTIGKIPLLRYFTVFNEAQIDGVKFTPLNMSNERPSDAHEAARGIVAGWKDAPEILHGFKGACYRRIEDQVRMPNPQSFTGFQEYYSTLFHELGHATGSPKRLDRLKGKAFGDENYAREELVAEMTSAFLCNKCGIDNHVIENQAAYIKNWLGALQDDPKLVVYAAGQAQKAANLIQGITLDLTMGASPPTKEAQAQKTPATAEKPAFCI